MGTFGRDYGVAQDTEVGSQRAVTGILRPRDEGMGGQVASCAEQMVVVELTTSARRLAGMQQQIQEPIQEHMQAKSFD